MKSTIKRSIGEQIRQVLSWSERWRGEDQGLIWCWENGRLPAEQQPEIAAAAIAGELPTLVWEGGVERKLQSGQPKLGTLQYLAMWQGMREEDLNVDRAAERTITCARTGQAVIFRARTTGVEN